MSHDRAFIDTVCNEILELDGSGGAFRHRRASPRRARGLGRPPRHAWPPQQRRGRARANVCCDPLIAGPRFSRIPHPPRSGNYSRFLEGREERYRAQEAAAANASTILRKEAVWMSRQPKARQAKSRSRQDNFYALKEKAECVVAVGSSFSCLREGEKNAISPSPCVGGVAVAAPFACCNPPPDLTAVRCVTVLRSVSAYPRTQGAPAAHGHHRARRDGGDPHGVRVRRDEGADTDTDTETPTPTRVDTPIPLPLSSSLNCCLPPLTSSPRGHDTRTQEVSLTFGSARILDRFSYAFGKGERVALVGPNGARACRGQRGSYRERRKRGEKMPWRGPGQRRVPAGGPSNAAPASRRKSLLRAPLPRLALLPAGAGKTTFLRVCLGQQEVDSGEVKIGQTVKFGHYTQLAEFPDPTMARARGGGSRKTGKNCALQTPENPGKPREFCVTFLFWSSRALVPLLFLSRGFPSTWPPCPLR